MFESITATLQLLLAFVGGVAAVPDPGALGLALALVATVVAVAALLVGVAPAPGERPGPHPRRAIDLSSPLTQSDPDAPGHPRPRAPQAAASAA